MFNFIKDSILHAQGVDVEAARNFRKEKRSQKEESRLFLSVKVMVIIGVIAFIYLIVALTQIVAVWGDDNATAVKHIVLSLLAIFICACLLVRNIIFEFVVIISSFMFVLLLYVLFILI